MVSIPITDDTDDEPEDVIPREMVEDYCRRSGDTGIGYPRVPWEWVYEESKGFITYFALDEALWIVNCYGDGVFWNRFAEERGRELGCKKVIFITQRSPKAFMRKYGYQIRGFVMEREITTKH